MFRDFKKKERKETKKTTPNETGTLSPEKANSYVSTPTIFFSNLSTIGFQDSILLWFEPIIIPK